MQTVSIFSGSIQVSLRTGPDICDTTRDLERLIAESQIAEGVLNATMVGSTGSLTTIEFEPGVIEDLKRAINSLAPPGADYAHELAWHDGNGHSHVQAALLGPSIALPVRGGSLSLGTWQQVVAINHDNRPRKRTIEVSMVGVAG
jgi:secondary thiamine-phosphate synthase enzyme